MELVRWWYSHSIHLVLYGSVEKWGGGATGIGWILRLLTFKFQEIQTYMLICFIRHFFLEGIRGQVSYHSENFNLTLRYIFCCSVIAFVIGQIWRGGQIITWRIEDCTGILNFVVNCGEISTLHLGKDWILSYLKKMMHTVYIPDKQ